MEEIIKKLNSIDISINNVEDEIIDAKNEITDVYVQVYEMKKKSIINIKLFKLKMQEEGLLTQEIEDFIENYLKFYNN